MATQSGPYPIAEGIEGASQTVRARNRHRQDLCCAMGPLRHLRSRRQGPLTEVVPHPPPRTLLQEHTATVKILAHIAYGDLPAQHQERYTYDAFVQSLNNLGLHHQLQAKGVTTVEP